MKTYNLKCLASENERKKRKKIDCHTIKKSKLKEKNRKNYYSP